MNRFELLNLLQDTIQDQLVVCNIGLPSQELYKINDRPNYFYMLGSMGLASSIGLGLSLAIDKNVISIDGDGSVLMNMNTLATIGNRAPSNYTLLIVDNGSYGSTGDQKTFTDERTSLKNVAIGAGCQNVIECSGEETNGNLAKAIELYQLSAEKGVSKAQFNLAVMYDRGEGLKKEEQVLNCLLPVC